MPDMTAQPAVVAKDLVLRHGATEALAASSFGLPARGVTAIIGPNGSGKSTVLDAIAGLHEPASGSITVLGTTPAQARSRISFVPQSTKVNDTLPVTVREVVAMGRYASLGLFGRFGAEEKEAVDEALERLDLRAFEHHHIRELSGGQRQRVFVAQGLVQGRELLLLDEPGNALDLVSLEVIRTAVDDERAAGRPVVITTHDLDEARRADHVLLLSNRVVCEGRPTEVLTPEHLAKAYRFHLGEVGGRPHVDDAAHDPAAVRHVHVDPNRVHGA